MEDGLLSLKWNNHRSTFFHILSEVRGKHTYTDATLACEGKFFPVHKLVMSTCSDYFAEIFEKTPCKNPVVVLKDIKKSDLEALLDYMYIGEVDVRQSELAGLIKAAECLRIKGLAVPDEDPTKAQKKGPTNVPERREDSPPAKRKRRDSGGERGRPPSPPVPRGSSQSSSSHSSSTSSVPSQAPPQISSVPESHVPSQSMPPPPSLSQEGRSRGEPHAQPTQHQSQLPAARGGSDPPGLRSPEASHPASTTSSTSQSPRAGDSSLLPVQIKVEVDEAGGGKDNHGDREDTSEIDGDEEEASNDFEYQGHAGEIEKEEHDQMDYSTDQLPGPSGLQGGPPVLSWGEEGEGGFPHNLFGGDDAAAQQAVSVMVTFNLDGVGSRCCLVLGLSASMLISYLGEAGPLQMTDCSFTLGQAVPGLVAQLSLGSTSSVGQIGSVIGLNDMKFCQICGRKCRSSSELQRHYMTHTGEKPFRCPHCPYSSTLKTNGGGGRKSRARWGTVYQCPFCGKLFRDKTKWSRHCRVHTGDKPFVCGSCGKAFSRKDRLHAHLRDAHQHLKEPHASTQVTNHLPVAVWEGLLPQDGELRAAVEVVMGVAGGEDEDSLPIHSPPSGQERGSSESKSSRKNRARRGTANYACPFCAKLFLDKSKWSRHLYAHTGEKPFVCGICARRFSRKDNLQTHMKDKHRIFKVIARGLLSSAGEKIGMAAEKFSMAAWFNLSSLGKYTCSECGKDFRQREDLRRHHRIHTGEKPYACPWCSHRCTQLSHLKDHVKRRHNHTGTIPGVGQGSLVVAGRLAASEGVVAHGRLDTAFGDDGRDLACRNVIMPKYYCLYCGKAFYQIEDHRRHVRVGWGLASNRGTGAPWLMGSTSPGSKYQCLICGKNHRQLVDLKRHVRIHTGEKPYACPYCSHRCTRNGHLRDHIRRKHSMTEGMNIKS
ncbi:hypothetical protein Pmani_027284 [Petrolisthes manimaculis]|uniref:Uncharacterized protein n=1 Tax=Petrolisthes manimaculis TaxID=1843537 RepID=A0AAE1TWZ6_9EUCA|nr:hypothetical protein Pmani_027284 [Petrolisthes manimaculis]